MYLRDPHQRSKRNFTVCFALRTPADIMVGASLDLLPGRFHGTLWGAGHPLPLATCPMLPPLYP